MAMILAAISANTLASEKSLKQAGDILQMALPISALGVTFLKGDTEGSWQLAKSTGTTIAITHALKFASQKRRPDFSSNSSFPSGHTATAFSGASFYYTRYGAKWGVPAYALAAYTGWSRVNGEKHYWDDVVAGASIAILSNLYFTKPISEDVLISPRVEGDSLGLNLLISNAAFGNKPSRASYTKSFDPEFRFEFAMGPSQMKMKNAKNTWLKTRQSL